MMVGIAIGRITSHIGWQTPASVVPVTKNYALGPASPGAA